MVEAANSYNSQSGGKEMFWIEDCDDLCWSPGVVVQDRGNTFAVRCILTGDHYEIKKSDAINIHPSCLDGANDLLTLGEFNEGALLHTIRERHTKRQIYTSIGSPILLSVNPYERLNIYTTSIAQKYRKFALALRAGGATESDRPEPHLFMVAEDTYQDLNIDRKNQSIIITGESGAGKTEATKVILSYLAKASQGFSGPEEDLLYKKPTSAQLKAGIQQNAGIEKQVLDSNPLLEAFGNAKTFKNNNSSRFGKFIQVNFDATGVLHSASIVNYLLEKSRIIYQQGLERNFHIFYQILKAFHLDKSEQPPLSRKFLQKYQLQDLEDYHYVNQSDVFSIDDVDDAADFEMTLQCMKNVHFSDPEIAQILDIVVAILNIGNIEFGLLQDDNPGPTKSSQECLQTACRLLQVDMMMLVKALTKKQTKIAKEVIESALTIDQAYQERDSMCKDLYSHIFSWIVQKVNAAISVQGSSNQNKKKNNLQFIGLLDIFGFEIFTSNSFEQLCINYANEKLQQQFNQHMFTLEQEEYVHEGIKWSNIEFKDNQHTIEMIENPRNASIFKLLDDQFRMGKSGSDQKFFDTMNQMLNHTPSYKRNPKLGSQSFIIAHYAGQVAYDIEGFVEKNKDNVGVLITETLGQSKQTIIQSIFKPLHQAQSQQNVQSLAGNSLSSQFRGQLQQLINTLRKSQPRYVRCIKPNSKFSPSMFDSYDVRNQLKCAGMLEAIRIRKAGYSIRMKLDEFVRRYRPCLKKGTKGLEKPRDAAQAITDMLLKAQPKLAGKFQVGISKMFLKEETRSGLEQLLNNAVIHQAVLIQSAARGRLARKKVKKLIVYRAKIKRFLWSVLHRQRLRKAVYQVVESLRKAVKKIQSMWRRRRIHKKLMIEVNKRIAFKHRLAYDKEQERLRKIHEQQQEAHGGKQVSKRDTPASQETQNQSTLLSEGLNVSDMSMTGVTGEMQKPIGGMVTRENSGYSSRFEKNLKNIEAIFGDSQQIQNLQEELKKERELREQLEEEMRDVQAESNEKDKKIRELTIRLESTRKYARGQQSTNTSDVIGPGGTTQFLTENSSEMSMLRNLTTNFGNSLFTPDGQFKDDDDLEEKNNLIDDLKSKIELLESEKDNQNQQLEFLQQENDSLNKQKKKWISKVDEEMEKNHLKVQQLNQQIKSLQDQNNKLEITARLENSFQNQEEEISRLSEQLKDKQDQIDALEHKFFAVNDEHSLQTSEYENTIRKLQRQIAKMEQDHIEATQEFEKTQEDLIMKDEQVLSLETELEILRQNENSQNYEMSMQRVYRSFVEAGRVAYINYGSDYGRVVVIVDIADQNRVLVDGDDFPRVLYPLKRLTLTKLKVPLSKGARTGTLQAAAEEFGLEKKWEETPTAKMLARRERRAELTDFERFAVMRQRKSRSHAVKKLVHRAISKKPAKKPAKPAKEEPKKAVAQKGGKKGKQK